MKTIQIVPEKTAISNGVANSASLIAKSYPLGTNILDYGAGKLRNTHFLLKHGYQVSIIETPLQLLNLASHDLSKIQHIYSIEEDIYEQFDVILCSFVLNVIPKEEERGRILTRSRQLLKEDGHIFLEVRKSRGILKNKHKMVYRDGYVIGNGTKKTFQKPYEKEEIVDYVSAHGYSVESVQSTSDGWLIVAQNKHIQR